LVKVDFAQPKEALETDGSDHVSSSKIRIGRLGMRDLKNGRSAARHAARSDGQDRHAVDEAIFPQECF
jgi:hypothetical protein